MRKESVLYLLGLSLIFVLSGCVVRTYPVTKDRIDQDLTSGNRGYLKGQAPAVEVKERKTKRTTRVVEVELHSPIRFEKMPKAKPQETPAKKSEIEETKDQTRGNRGFITQSYTPEIQETPAIKKYTVQKGDTLQKVSQKFYGTTKKWTKIYDANRAILKGPNKIYPGQVIDIPLDTSTPLSVNPERSRGIESLKETPENLK